MPAKNESGNEKLKIDLAPIAEKVIRFDIGEETYKISLIPYISISNKVEIIQNYINCLYEDNVEENISTKYIASKYMLILEIVERLTNIDVESLSIDLVYNSGLWGKLVSEIYNYSEFEKELNEVVKIKETEILLSNSVGKIVNDISIKVIDLLDKIKNIDVDTLKNISKEFKNNLDELNKKYPGLTETSKPRKETLSAEPVRKPRKKKVQ